MNGFIILVICKDLDVYFISNTCPILWTSNKNEAKVFEKYVDVISDIEINSGYITKFVKDIGLKNMYIVQYENDIEIGRQRIL